MPEYQVRDPQSGKTLVLRGDTPPSEQELEQIFARVNAAPQQQARTLDTLIDLLPAAGGTVGGIVGGIGGSAFGMGVGGVPGAVGGAALGGGAGEALRQLSNRVLGRKAPDTSLDALTGIVKEGGIQGAAEGVGGAVAKGATTGARAVYRGYLKPSLAASKVGKADEIVETALREALPIASSGTAKAQRLITELRSEVSSILKASPEKIDLHTVAQKVRAFAKARYFTPGADDSSYQAALKVADSLDAHPSLGLPPGAKPSRVTVPLSKADDTKRALDTGIGESSFGVESGAAKSTRKQARHLVRKELEAKAPAIAPLNARESKLIDAAQAIKRAVAREANQNPVYGVKTLVAGAYGGSAYASGDDPASAAGKALAARMLLTPAAQSRAAIIASRLAKQMGVSAAVAARVAVHTLSGEQQPQE